MQYEGIIGSDETWKPVNDYPCYAISSYGRLKRISKGGSGHAVVGKILNVYTDRRGYFYYDLCKSGSVKRKAAHILVAAAFIGKRPVGLTVNHIDTNKANNHYANLEYMTNADNVRHGFASGCYPLGIDRTKAKITREMTKEIQGLMGKLTCKAIARKFGIRDSTVVKINQKKTTYSKE